MTRVQPFEKKPEDVLSAVPEAAEEHPKQPSISKAIEGTSGAVESVVHTAEASKRIQEALATISPIFQEALRHPLAAKLASPYGALNEINGQNEFKDQENLLRSIESLNKLIENLMKAMADPKARLDPRAGEKILEAIRSDGDLLLYGGVIIAIRMALKVLARTKIREAAKPPSSEPFDQEEYERERALHQIIQDLE